MQHFHLYVLALCFLLLGMLSAQAQTTLPEDSHSAVIFAYHKVGADSDPSASIRLSQLEEHIQELQQNEYNVLPLQSVLEAQKNGDTLAPNTVVLTFDGGYKSVFTDAAPRLIKAGLPFTVFFAADHASRNIPDYMNWQDLQKLAKNDLVTLGIHPASYIRLYDQPKEEITRQINKARSLF